MAETVIMPKLGFDMAEGTLVRWVISEGKPVSKGAVLAEIETDKATVEVESQFEGIVARHLVPEGEVVPINTPIAIITAPGEKLDALESAQPKTPETLPPAAVSAPIQAPVAPVTTSPIPAVNQESGLPGGVRASPLARRIAAEQDVDLSAIRGSGPGGRITRRDVEASLAVGKPAIVEASSLSRPATIAQAITTKQELVPRPSETIPLNRLRAAIGRRMAEAKQQVPHFYVTHEYDMASLMELRKKVNAFLNEEEKLSVNDFILKATALALREYPNLNASLQGNQVIRHGMVHIGVAVAVDGGLLTVVCRDVDQKPLRQIAVEVKNMVGRAREGKVRPDDIEGSTFSVSNLGMFDVEHFIAIINPPEAAILAIGSVRSVPVVRDSQIVPGMTMKATISVDHRVSDGAEAAQFMQALSKYLEEPIRLLI